MLTQELARKILSEALSTGGDFAELFCEDTQGTTISLNQEGVENASYTHSRGVGVRVLCGRPEVVCVHRRPERRRAARNGPFSRGVIPGQTGTAGHFAGLCPPIPMTTVPPGFEGVNNAMRINLLRRMYQAAPAGKRRNRAGTVPVPSITNRRCGSSTAKGCGLPPAAPIPA